MPPPARIKFLAYVWRNKSAEGFDPFDKTSDFNRCEVEVKDNSATLYTVVNGVKSKVSTTGSEIKWNDKNELKYQLKDINDEVVYLTVTINGERLFSEVALDRVAYGKYMGFYNPKMNIRVY